ncbi:MAG: putative membrane protein insertion efficiency factor [Planctomycetota bacterium]|jgi:putative membrane protein insertion efficiency factor
MWEFVRQIPGRCLQGLVKFYQLGPGRLLPQVCRFKPSCSSYMLRSLQLHGACKGSWFGMKRICKCHPWHDGGYDPVPGDEEKFFEQELN